MAASKKRGSDNLSTMVTTKKGKSSSHVDLPDFMDELIDKVSQSVNDRLELTIQAVIDKQVPRIVEQIKASFECRVVALESTCKELTDNLEFQYSEFKEKIAQLNGKIVELEHQLESQETDANFVLSGVSESEQEDLKKVVLDVCENILGVHVTEHEVLQVTRLGRPRTKQSTPPTRPRPILVKTQSRHVKARVMPAKAKPAVHAANIFINDDLTKAEQNNRRQLVPVYKALRSNNIRCRLERGCLVVGSERYRDPAAASAGILRHITDSRLKQSLQEAIEKTPQPPPFLNQTSQ